MSYQNTETFYWMSELDEIEPHNLFVSDDNYAFDAAELKLYFGSGSFNDPYSMHVFSADEIQRMEKMALLAPVFSSFKSNHADLGRVPETFISEMQTLCRYGAQHRTDEAGCKVLNTDEDRHSALVQFKAYYDAMRAEDKCLVNGLLFMSADFIKKGFVNGFDSIFELKADSCFGDAVELGLKLTNATRFFNILILNEKNRDKLVSTSPTINDSESSSSSSTDTEDGVITRQIGGLKL